MPPASPRSRTLKPTSKPVVTYYAALKALAAQGAKHEQAVRSAFQTLLGEAARPHKWTAIPELGSKVRGKRVVPDGTMRDAYNLPRGYWEAKDSADNLDAEIADKLAKGYPATNTIFWTPARAVLIQNRQRVLDEDITGPAALCAVLQQFFAYTEKPIEDFSAAVDAFTLRVPELGRKLAEIIADAHKNHPPFKKAFAAFFELCKTALNPEIAPAAVDEMLIQHLLTERLFKTVFNNPEFVRRNVIASEVDKVIDALSSRFFTREEFLKSLDLFYLAIERAAAQLTDFSEKQHFLNTIYERFFQGYCVKTADTHGIVYTPQPIVDFMCASVEHVLKAEFELALGDKGVEVLDPCTGTGNFVVNLMRRAAERGKKPLERMYREQLFANEIMLMPYYIAAMNIEHAFYELTGNSETFEGLCFVDTLELAEPKHTGLFTEANAERVTRQKNAPITIVIGNPPYNVGQMTHNEQNKNRPYPTVDQWVRTTYGKDSAATSVSKLNDPYVKFFKWATRRLEGRDGIVCFVSNNTFVKKVAFDGMRKHLSRDFQAIYHVNLEGDVRENDTLSGTQYNVFGIKVGVGVTVAVKRKSPKQRGIRYTAVQKDIRRLDKLAWIASQTSITNVKWTKLVPDSKNNWLVPGNAVEFASFISVADKNTRGGSAGAPNVIFRDYTLGVATHRDSVVYDFSRESLNSRIRQFIDDYNAEVDRWKRAIEAGEKPDADDFVKYDRLAWDDDLKRHLTRMVFGRFDAGVAVQALFRPFTREWLYRDRLLNARVYGCMSMFPSAEKVRENIAIACSDLAFRAKTFSALVTASTPDLHLCATLDGHQCFPFYIYDEDGTNRRENITDWALKQFRTRFKNNRITKWDIFYYVYGVLHHPGYREKFADNLKRELPRIPFAPDFKAFVKAGERLAELHLGYDDEKVVKPFKLKEVWAAEVGKSKARSYRVERMKLTKEKDALVVNERLTLTGIPAEVFEYRLGNRSALDWVIDQYQVHTDARSGITSDPNAWGEERDDAEYIVRLVKQVVTVSLETMKIVKGLPAEFSSGDEGGGVEVADDGDGVEAEKGDQAKKGRGKKITGVFELRSEPPAQPRLPM